MDVRVLAAVEKSLETGETVMLPQVHRTKRVVPEQALKLPPANKPRSAIGRSGR